MKRRCSLDHIIVVLDHTCCMLREGPPSTRVDLDVSSRNKSLANQQQSPTSFFVSRSFWTSAVENALELRRVVNDIFHSVKNVCFMGYDAGPEIILDWTTGSRIPQSQVLEDLAAYGAPKKDVETFDFEQALKFALKKLSTVTDRGLIIFMSSSQTYSKENESRMACLFRQSLSSQQYFAKHPSLRTWSPRHSNDVSSELFLNQVNLELISLHDRENNDSKKGTTEDGKEGDASTAIEGEAEKAEGHDKGEGLYRVGKGAHFCLSETNPCLNLWQTVMKCICRNLHLACSIISHIPMKEEQQKHSSLNYDVELLHESEAHHVLLSDQSQFVAKTSLSSGGIPAVTLKWLSPKLEGGPEAITNCIGTYRVSPLDVLARHSTCLTNFLTSGRTVTLEQSERVSNGTTSTATHIMTCHSGVIYLHILAHSRPNAPLDDGGMLSITESPGGKLLDYRVPDFVKLIKSSILVPLKDNSIVQQKSVSKQKKKFFDRKTKYFPLTSGQSLLTNLSSYLPRLMETLTKLRMSDGDYTSTCGLINSLAGLEKQNVSLPVSNSAARPSKKDEQYKLMWLELSNLTKLFAHQSGKHKAIDVMVNSFKNGTALPNNLEQMSKEDVIDLSDDQDTENNEDDDDHFIDGEMKSTRKRKNDTSSTKDSNDSSNTNKRRKLVPSCSPLIQLTPEMFAGKKSLYDVWNSQVMAAFDKKRKVFSKRYDANYSLYCHLNLKDESTAT